MTAPAAKLVWTLDEARAIAGDACISASRTAGSPLATINALGPTVVATDFGNNAGLILGAGFGGRTLARAGR